MTWTETLPVDLRPVGLHRFAGTVRPGDLVEVARALFDQGMRLALVSGHDDGTSMRAVYLFTAGPPDTRVELHVPLDPAQPEVPTLAALSFPASRFEREMADLFGIEPLGHPQPRRLVLHQHWPRDWHPMRHGSPNRPDGRLTPGRSPSCPSKDPASTRSRSGRSTPGSSSPATSGSGSSARPSCA